MVARGENLLDVWVVPANIDSAARTCGSARQRDAVDTHHHRGQGCWCGELHCFARGLGGCPVALAIPDRANLCKRRHQRFVSFGLIGAFGWGKRVLATFPYRAVRRGDCWVSNSSQASYNRRINAAECDYPNEDLWRIARGGAYDMAVISDFNYETPIRGKGSAIFLHVHSYTNQGRSKPTSGCVSVVRSAMSKILEWLDSGKFPRMVIMQRRDLPLGW